MTIRPSLILLALVVACASAHATPPRLRSYEIPERAQNVRIFNYGAVNSAGTVSGFAAPTFEEGVFPSFRPVSYRNGAFTYFDTGYNHAQPYYGQPRINARGTIMGIEYPTVNGAYSLGGSYAVIDGVGRVVGGIGTYLFGINDQDEFTGYESPTGIAEPIVYRNGVKTKLNGGQGIAWAINNSGTIAGSVRVGEVDRAAFWSPGSLDPTFINAPAGACEVTDIAEDGGMLGVWYGRNPRTGHNGQHAFIYRNGAFDLIDYAFDRRYDRYNVMEPVGIANGGLIVYAASENTPTPTGGVMVYQNGVSVRALSLLNDTSFTFLSSQSVTLAPNGSFVAFGKRGSVGTLLVVTPVPEPATIVALGAGAIGLIRRSRRQRGASRIRA